ncbi:DNA cytosine methyltransferase [Bacillus subtilis]|uniref:DNA cytosine methyltransferase n=1 Tax=Bacillus subtilis TaxID=1423 RepID=UPI0035147B74
MSTTVKFKLIDLFAGAGGLSNGFEQTGRFKVIGAVEINKEAVQTYIYNHNKNTDIIIKPKGSEISDITKIKFSDYLKEKNINNNETVVIGGPPCQGFSNANRQKNHLISGNNQLVKEFARAIDEIKPVGFLLENVKTMNSEKHKFFVTEQGEGVFAYSSEEHLQEITTKLGKKPLWEKEKLVLMDSTNINLKSLIDELIEKSFTPFLTSNIHLSRMRSLLRNLKSDKVYNVVKKKEEEEIKSIIQCINEYDFSLLNGYEVLNRIFLNTKEALISLIQRNNNDNKLQINKLNDFIELNQLLKHLEELKQQKIKIVGKTKAKLINEKLIVSVTVKSYNIVKYLTYFFKFIGYEIKTEVMLASDFGTPQNRHRFMILGIKKDYVKNGPVKMPEKFESEKLPFTVYDAIKDLENIAPTKDVVDNKIPYSIDSQKTEMQHYFRSTIKGDFIYNHINTDSKPLSRQRFEALKQSGGRNFHSLSKDLKEISYTDGSRTQNTVYLRMNYHEPSPTVINVRKSMWQHPEKAEALSIREAARLQSFKDDYVFIGAKDKQYQQVGNAVPPLLARAVAEQMLYILGDKPIKKITDEFNF